MEENYKLSHLRELEAESIHIIREVAAEFENPVMLYSIGKDSSVMVRLAEKDNETPLFRKNNRKTRGKLWIYEKIGFNFARFSICVYLNIKDFL